MAKKWRDLIGKLPAERQERIRAGTAALLAEMPLYALRQAREQSQTALAKELGGSQASVSKMERRTDMYLSTLRSYIEAMGGELEIIASFPDGKVRINQFKEIGG